MDLSKMTPEEARAIVMQAQNVFDASIADQQRSTPKEIQSLPLDLSTARTRADAMKVSFPFKSVLVEQATDLNTYIYLIPISNDSGNDPIRLGTKDIYKNEFGFRECYIYWDAQPNKTILLKFFVRSFLENGRLLLDQNSATDYLSLGGANCQNDGFTFIGTSEVSLFNTTNTNPLIMTPSVDKSFFKNGITTGIVSNSFLVPEGYYAEAVGLEIDVTKAITSTDWRLTLSKCPVGTNITTNSVGSAVAQAIIPNIGIISGKKLYFNILSTNTRVRFNENEVIILSHKNSDTTNYAGDIKIYIIFRIYKKVG